MKPQFIFTIIILLTTLLIAQGLRSFVPELLKSASVDKHKCSLAVKGR